MNMKNIFYLFLMVMLVASCELDNFSAPDVTLSGKVVDNVTNDMIENGGLNSGTVIMMYEGNSKSAIYSSSFPDGHFVNSRLFAGNYKLVMTGPFKMMQDTVSVTLPMSGDLIVKVLPNVRLKATLVSSAGTTATVKVDYEKVISTQVLNKLGVVWSTITNPNVETFFGGGSKIDVVTSQNLTQGSNTYTITGLTAGTKYYIRAVGVSNAAGSYANYSTTVTTP
jgi:hypothetical protein